MLPDPGEIPRTKSTATTAAARPRYAKGKAAETRGRRATKTPDLRGPTRTRTDVSGGTDRGLDRS